MTTTAKPLARSRLRATVLLVASFVAGACTLEEDLISETGTAAGDSENATMESGSESGGPQSELLICEQGGGSGCTFACQDQDSCQTACPGAACQTLCDNVDNCGIDCQGGPCTGLCLDSGDCSQSCPDGGCTMVCESGTSCSLDCPGDACTLACEGTSSCEITNCGSGCNVQCTGADSCTNSCSLVDGCTTIAV